MHLQHCIQQELDVNTLTKCAQSFESDQPYSCNSFIDFSLQNAKIIGQTRVVHSSTNPKLKHHACAYFYALLELSSFWISCH